MYDLMVTYNSIDPKMDTTKFCNILGIDIIFIANLKKIGRVKDSQGQSLFLFIKKLSPVTHAQLQESLWEFPGSLSSVAYSCGYPHHSEPMC